MRNAVANWQLDDEGDDIYDLEGCVASRRGPRQDLTVLLEPTHDAAAIRGVLCHPSIWRGVTDDFSPTSEEFVPLQSEQIHYLLVKDGGEVLGLVIFVAHSPVWWEILVNFLPRAWWKQKTRAAFLMALDWAWTNSGCQRIIAQIACPAHGAVGFPPTLGMTRYGVNLKCVQKNGELIDQHLYGISRPQSKKE